MDEHKDCKDTEDELWARIEKLDTEVERLKKQLHENLVFVGYTNGYQILYAAEGEGLMFNTTENDCDIPLYMLKTHLHRVETTSSMDVTYEKIKAKRKQTRRGCWCPAAVKCDCPACGGFND